MINAIASNENNEEILVDDLSDLLESLLYNEEIIPQDLAFLYPHVDSLVNKYKDQEDFVGYLLPISDLSFWVQRISPKGKELLKDYLLQRFGSEKLKKTLAGHEADMFQLIDDNEKEEYHQTREKTKEELEKAIKSNPKLDQFMQLITDFQREVDKNQLIEGAFWNLVPRDDMALVVTYLMKAYPEIWRSIGTKILADAGKKLGEQGIQN